MDRADADPASLRRSLRFIRRINRLLGYTGATVRHLERFSRDWKPGEPIRLIDLATGSGDIPRAILRWADRRRLDVRIVGVDLQPQTVREARRCCGDSRFTLVRADALRPPFQSRSFDYAMCSMFLHHLSDDCAVELLRVMDKLATRGIIVADLLRHRRAYAWIVLMTLGATEMVRHDARASVRQAFTKDEVLALRERAGVRYAAYHRHFAHRFVLAGEKPNLASPRA